MVGIARGSIHWVVLGDLDADRLFERNCVQLDGCSVARDDESRDK